MADCILIPNFYRNGPSNRRISRPYSPQTSIFLFFESMRRAKYRVEKRPKEKKSIFLAIAVLVRNRYPTFHIFHTYKAYIRHLRPACFVESFSCCREYCNWRNDVDATTIVLTEYYYNPNDFFRNKLPEKFAQTLLDFMRVKSGNKESAV